MSSEKLDKLILWICDYVESYRIRYNFGALTRENLDKILYYYDALRRKQGKRSALFRLNVPFIKSIDRNDAERIRGKNVARAVDRMLHSRHLMVNWLTRHLFVSFQHRGSLEFGMSGADKRRLWQAASEVLCSTSALNRSGKGIIEYLGVDPVKET